MNLWPLFRGSAPAREPNKYLFEPQKDITPLELAQMLRLIAGDTAYDYEVKKMPSDVARHFRIKETEQK